MSKNFESTLDFVVVSSRMVRLLLSVLHVSAFLACWLNELPILARVIFSFGVVISWRISDSSDAAKRIHLRYTGKQGWKMSFNGKDFLAIAIKPSSVITETMTFLHYTDALTAKFGVQLLVRDALPAGDYRKMLVALKLWVNGVAR